MGELAKKVAELFGKPEVEKKTPAPAVPSPSAPTARKEEQPRSLYHQTAESVEQDCWSIDPSWLVDTHPDLWQRLVALDEKASDLERKGETGEPYRRTLERIAATVREARQLYNQETGKKETAS